MGLTMQRLMRDRLTPAQRRVLADVGLFGASRERSVLRDLAARGYVTEESPGRWRVTAAGDGAFGAPSGVAPTGLGGAA
jgi:hypothetical protein